MIDNYLKLKEKNLVTFEKEEVVVCILRNKKGDIILQKKTLDYKKAPGQWCLFGGQAESKDLNKEMKRELREELGMRLNPKFIFTKKIKARNKNIIFYVFLEKINDLSKIKLGEGAGFALFDKKELKNLNIAPEIKMVLKEYFKK